MTAHGARPAPRALTIDAWYTLLYVTTPERVRMDARRRRLWSAPLQEAGLSDPQVRRLLASRQQWLQQQEAGGRTPDLPEQMRWLAERAGLPLRTQGLATKLDRVALGAAVRLAPGAMEALELLEREGVPLGLVSNVLNESGEAARTVLDRLGLLRRFRVAVLSCEHPWAKPAPQLFRLACRFLEVPPRRAVHIGDLGYDLRGARAAGLGAWWYTGLRRWNRYLPGQATPADLGPGSTLRSWAEVLERLSP